MNNDAVLNNIGLVYKKLNKYASRDDFEDILSVGKLALCEAVNDYTEESGCSFSTFACNYIEWAALRYFYESGNKSIPYVPREYARLHPEILEELQNSIRFDAPTCDGDGLDYSEVIGENDARFDDTLKNEDFKLLHEEIDNLPKDQGEILKKRYFDNKTNSEIAEEKRLELQTVKRKLELAKKELLKSDRIEKLARDYEIISTSYHLGGYDFFTKYGSATEWAAMKLLK